MSMITRCPACGTMFKVVPDQLRISEGWVRCGHCAEVFDAAAHLQGEVAATEAAVPAAERSSASALAQAGSNESEPESFSSSLTTEIDEEPASEPPDSEQLEEEAQDLAEDPRDQPFELRRQDGAIVQTRTASSEFESEPELHEVSFVREAQRKAFWARPLVRAALVAGVLVLAALLALQVAVQERDRLAASDPALRPWLARLCEPLNCRIAPPRQIDAIAIESSSFNKLRADAYRLNVTLKNQAALPVAMPALELTLTDGQDQALVRRVLVPPELGANASVIGAAGEWSTSLNLALTPGNGRIAGYRLLAFYP
jgi:predicted Zn finger-like uncharacterized protein